MALLSKGELAEDATADRLLVLDAPTILWSADAGTAAELTVGGKLTITLSGSLDAEAFTPDAERPDAVMVAVDGNGELLSVAVVNDSGEFIPLSQPTVLSLARETTRWQPTPAQRLAP
jgi:hypothetical protein